MSELELQQELARRLAVRASSDWASGDFGRTHIYYMREIALDLLREAASKSSGKEGGE